MKLDTYEGPHQDLRDTFEHAGGGMAVVDPAGRLLEVNDALYRLTGRPHGSLAATTLPALHHPGDPDAVRTLDSRLTMLQAERQLLDVSGDPIPVLLTLLPLDERTGGWRTLAHAQPLTTITTLGGPLAAAREAATAAVALRMLGGQALSSLLSTVVRDVAATLGVERVAVAELVERAGGRRTLRLRAAMGWDERLYAAIICTTGTDGEALTGESPRSLSAQEQAHRGPELAGAVARIGPASAPIGLLAACTDEARGHPVTGLDQGELEFLQLIANLLAEACWPGIRPVPVRH